MKLLKDHRMASDALSIPTVGRFKHNIPFNFTVACRD